MLIIVVGCGKTGLPLARALIAQEHDVVMIDEDPQQMKNAVDLDCIKITGVPFDLDVLRQAGAENAENVCVATKSDNVNIMVAQVATEFLKLPKTITRVFNPINQDVFAAFGLDTINQTDLIVSAFLRRIHGEEDECVLHLHQSSVQFSRFPTNQAMIGKDILQLTPVADKLVFGLLRKGRLHLAVAGIRVQAGDELVLAVKQQKQSSQNVREILCGLSSLAAAN